VFGRRRKAKKLAAMQKRILSGVASSVSWLSEQGVPQEVALRGMNDAQDAVNARMRDPDYAGTISPDPEDPVLIRADGDGEWRIAGRSQALQILGEGSGSTIDLVELYIRSISN